MLQLQRLEVEGFGPFAERQTIALPAAGVTVVYGENMRGKTLLLNAIRYAFFGRVLGRASRQRKLAAISNRDLAKEGKYGFSVSLLFTHDDTQYELLRDCSPLVETPMVDEDYRQSIMLKRGTQVLGPQERDHMLKVIFPEEISRFFLFDGELLQEYEELLINESEAGRRIAEAIEVILGVPALKRSRALLTRLADEADKLAAREAKKSQETQSLGNVLELSVQQREAHEAELRRKQNDLADLTTRRSEIEQSLHVIQKYATIIDERDSRQARFEEAGRETDNYRQELQRTMANAWRTLLREPVRLARDAVASEVQKDIDTYVTQLRGRAINQGMCDVCGQEVVGDVLLALKSAATTANSATAGTDTSLTGAMYRLQDLNRFDDSDNTGEIRQLWKSIKNLEIERATLKDRISELTGALSDSDPDEVRRTNASYAEVHEKISITKRSIDDEIKKILGLNESIERTRRNLEKSAGTDLRRSQLRARTLRDSAEVFGAAIERYKSELRTKVEATASKLFLKMTTEKKDFAGLTINESYGLSIRHQDGRAEEARSAGAEHVVALALMGALQGNAPLQGPIVMDSPFGRLDADHTANVIKALPTMAEQIVLLVYEAEVDKTQMREILGSSLVREYRMEKVSSRRTIIRDLK